MNKLSLCLLVVALLLPHSSSLGASKRPLRIDDIESWKRITERVISPDGNWIAYKTQPARGDSKVFLYSSQGERKFERQCGENLRFTDDSKFLVFTIRPEFEHVRALKLERAGREDMPRDSLAIYSINSGTLDVVERIHSHKLPGRWAPWLAYQVEPSARRPDEENGAKRESHRNGFALHVRNLETGETRSWPFVTEYDFVAASKKLLFVSTGDGEGLKAGLYRFDLETGALEPVMTGRNDYRQIGATDDGAKVAFLCRNRGRRRSSEFGLYLWSGGEVTEIVGNRNPAIPQGWRISEHGHVRFSASGKRVFFGIAPVRPTRDPNVLDEEFPDVDVWHGSEGLLHTVQLVNRERELRRTYRTMYDTADGRIVRIETEQAPQSTLLDGGDGGRVLLHTNKPYELQSMWDPMLYDVYLLDLATGKRTTVAKGLRSRVRVSPEGKYLLWFDYSDYSYYTYRIDSGERFPITNPETLRADTETNTTFDYNAPYGTPGWLRGDRAVLIYDRYDVWKVDPEGRGQPVNLTVNGRANRTVYRLIRFGRGADAVDHGQPQYVAGANEVSRASGYYRCRVDEPGEPVRLIGGDYRLSVPLKAADADTVVFTKETFETFPDLLVSDLTFRGAKRISDANPQQADFLWGTAELCSWTSLDGIKLEGLLYKPEGFDPSRRYPMIVQFFHKSSNQLHYHRTPEFHRSRIDYHYFVSNGYLVFNPDIHFNKGYIGESAYNSIMPGVTSLVDRGFVDPKRVGAQGHSYSGYQAAYLATRTNLFACIEAGAPVVNFFSAYGGIRWQTGRNRAAQYEHDQTLATIWEAPLRFLENSPLFAMDKVTTPILILHNDRDGAVPWYQGIEYFIALRRMHKPVWLLNYNGEGHCLGQQKNKKDFQIRLSQFFGHYLMGKPMPRWMATGVPAVDKDHDLGYGVDR